MQPIDLTGIWHFQPDPVAEGKATGYHRRDYDTSLWREVRVPGDYDTCHPSLEAYEGGAWYRRTFSIPEVWQNRRIMLRFNGVYARMKVWVNGHLAGDSNLPFLPMEVTVTDLCDINTDNVIAVWVDNTRKAGEVPGMQRGWRTFGGLLRDVILYSTEYLYIDRIITMAEPSDVGGHLSIQVVVRNQHILPYQVQLAFTLTDQSSKVWESLDLDAGTLSPGAASVVSTNLVVPGAHLWSPQAPNLYTLNISLVNDNRTIKKKSVRVGFRQIKTEGDRLLLNGVPVYLTGFNRHEDSMTHNMCVDLKTARFDFEAMKDAGANFVRLCHYPHDEGEIDLCDELGLMVMEEIPLYWWDGLAEGNQAYQHKLEEAQAQLTALIQRDRNHPSVVFWSVSNETEEQRMEVVEGNETLVSLAQEIDPTRLAVHVSDHWQEAGQFERDDVICVNAYPTWGEKIIRRNANFNGVDGGHTWHRNLEILNQRYPRKPILVTEFGYVSFPGIYESTVGEKTHAEVIEQEFKGMQAPYVCGATVWCWADHPWPAATFQFAYHLGMSPYGILARNRRRKRPYYIIRQLFREKQGFVERTQKQKSAPAPDGYPVTMVRYDMDNIPQYAFPEGYDIRNMRLDDGGLWKDIWDDADPASNIRDDLYQYEFSHDYQATTWRSFIVTDPDGLGVGIISAWYNQQFQGGLWGVIHWVALRRRVWGIGLGKAMMTHAMNYLAKWHNRAYLVTQTKRLAAIKNYLDFGFMPFLDAPGARDHWRGVAAMLPHQTFVDMGLIENA